ncbi:hypothetical protein OAV88_01100 [bacterium]|nr:hypothetical protein [bacterium]
MMLHRSLLVSLSLSLSRSLTRTLIQVPRPNPILDSSSSSGGVLYYAPHNPHASVYVPFFQTAAGHDDAIPDAYVSLYLSLSKNVTPIHTHTYTGTVRVLKVPFRTSLISGMLGGPQI